MSDPARDAARDAIAEWFAAQEELRVDRLDEDSWFTMLAGERKRTIPVHLEVSEHGVVLQSFFMRAPDENEAELYDYLLRRNLRSYVFRFALATEGDVLLLAVLPHAAVDTVELDRVMGQLLAAADEAFDKALRLGFASYIDREQAWRERVGAPRNPIT